jgi:ribosomal protein S18
MSEKQKKKKYKKPKIKVSDFKTQVLFRQTVSERDLINNNLMLARLIS